MASQPIPQSDPQVDDDFYNVWLEDNEILIRFTTEGPMPGGDIGRFIDQLENLARISGFFGDEGFFEIVTIEQGSVIARLKAWHDRTTEWRKGATEYATIGAFLVGMAMALGNIADEDPIPRVIHPAPITCPAPIVKIEVRSNSNRFVSPAPELRGNSDRGSGAAEWGIGGEMTVLGKVVEDRLTGMHAILTEDGRVIQVRLGRKVDDNMLGREASITFETTEGDSVPTVTQILSFA